MGVQKEVPPTRFPCPHLGMPRGVGLVGSGCPGGAAAPRSPQLHQPLRAVSPHIHIIPPGQASTKGPGEVTPISPHLPPSSPPGHVALVAPRGCCALTLGPPGDRDPQPAPRAGGAPCHPVWHCCTCRCHFPRATAGATWMSPSPCCQHTAGTAPRAPGGSLLGRWLRTRGGDTAATLGSLSWSWQSPALCAGPAAALLLGTAGSATGRGSVPPGHRARPPLCDPTNHS